MPLPVSFLTPCLWLAPMAGFTDFAFRRLVEHYGGVGLLTTEMVHARGFLEMRRRGIQRQDRLFGIAPRGGGGATQNRTPLSVQIWDNDAAALEETARVLLSELDIQALDLNFGCPMDDVVLKARSGSWLLQFPEKIAEIVRRVVLAAEQTVPGTPVTAKVRLGLTAEQICVLEVAHAIEEAGAAALTVHGRTTEQRYSGQADWEQIARVKEALRIPVIGNGDVRSPRDVQWVLKDYGVDGVMIGRGALTQPWIFRQAQQLLEGEPESVWGRAPSAEEQKALLLEHFHLLRQYYSERDAAVTMRRFAACYGTGLPNAKKYRLRINTATCEADFREAVQTYFPKDG